ncbi:cadherin-23 isoform X6 [Patella vulgata]|uniref:cadherin-23 isoform X6 n=1 Tax=Patella vulgata TaxID=6465 RepID=UPI0021801129|nr:cadherin-23 isoform X6 [Patella vulgata]
MAGWSLFQNKINQRFLSILLLSLVIQLVTANNPPYFIKFESALVWPEDTAVGTILGNLTGVDTDGPAPLEFKTDTTDTGNLVELSPPRDLGSGTRIVDIKLKAVLDRDYEPSERQLFFKVSDKTSEIPAKITLFIRDVNDVKPQFKNLPYKATVNESVSPNTVMFMGVTADDPDNGRGGTVQYSMETDAQAADEDYRTTFEIDPISGNITVKKPLNYEKHNFYQFKIKAVDGIGLEAEPADFVVTVLDVQDTPPYFVNLPYSAEVNESVSIGTSILQVSGLDGDRGVPNNLTYSFLRGDYEKFNIDSSTGVITVKSPLDRDSQEVRNRGGVYAMYVEASEIVPANQVNNGLTTASTLVTITVEDVNDNSPVFNKINYKAQILENMQNGVPVTFVNDVMRVSDIDQGTNSHFVLSVEQNGQPYYDFTPLPQEVYSESTILLRVNNSNNLDYEKNPEIIFQVVAREVDTVEKRSSTATVTVTVEDMNDNAPVFPNETYVVRVKENTDINTVIQTIQATDADEGVFGSITYSIRGGNNKFGINKQTGGIYIAASLDREETDEYYLTAEAKDDGGLRTPVEVKVIIEDMNDEKPVFRRQEYEAILRESDSDFLRPLFVEATDDDQVNTANSFVKYRIIETPANLQNNFTINPDNGHITITIPIDYEKLDQSLNSVVNLKVEAIDQGSPPLASTVNVSIVMEDLNDNAPVFEQNKYSAVVPENSTEGTVLLVVKATDLDGTNPNNEFIYRIESGALDKFRINFATGELTVETGAKLNREEKDVYIMNVSAIDKGTPPQTGRCTVVVNLTDVNDEIPIFQQSSQSVTIPESATIGDGFVTYAATDADLNSELSYQIIKDGYKAYDDRNEEVDVESNNITDYFNVIPNTGVVYVSAKLDREIAERIVLKILATDLGAWSPKIQTATATLTVLLEDSNDNAPVFKPSSTYVVNISEGQDIESEALRVEAVDPDKNQQVTYDLDTIGDVNFKIDQQTGIIRIKKKLDRELEPSLTFVVVASDNGNTPMISSATVSVSVLDINDNAPIFLPHPQIYSVGEDAPTGTEVGKVKATDPDDGAFGEVFYLLEGIDSDGTFDIDQDQGVITVSKELDREVKAEYSLVVVATDNKANPKDQRSNRTTVTIHLEDVNDNAPQYNLNILPSAKFVRESATVGTIVVNILATDKDKGENGTVQYFLTGDTNATNAQGQAIFKVDQISGTMSVNADLRTATGVRYVTVNATDKGNPSQYNTTVLDFTIIDDNDDPPTFIRPDPSNPLVVIEEGQPVNTTIIMISATDDDQGENGQVVYSIIQSKTKQDWKKFHLDSITGRVSNKEVLDRETQKFYELQVRATDRGKPRNYSTDLSMTIEVKDVNDQEPEFDRSKIETPYKMSVLEESNAECVGNVSIAEDKDFDSNFTIICYYIVSTGLNDTFTLSPSGNLCLKNSIDRETTPYVYLVIQASSNCYEDRSYTIIPQNAEVPPEYNDEDPTLLWVNVSITDINDNSPKFKMKELALGITKTTQFGSFVYNLKNEVIDADSNAYGINQFSLISIDIQPEELRNELDGQVPFVLFPNGTVKTNTYFRSTMFGYFILSLVASDKGNKNDTANLRISLINDNQRLKVVFRERVEEVGKFKDDFASELQNITGYRIVVDKVQTHENDAGKPEIDKTDMFIHGEDLSTNEVVPAYDLLRKIDYNAERMVSILNDYNVLTIVPTYIEASNDETEKQLRMALILVSVILGALVIILIVAFYTSRRKYQRKLKAATAMAYGSQDSDLYKLEMPGTNIHSYENANPIYLEKILLGEMEEDGISHSSSFYQTYFDHQNSLDENAIETNPSYDEQEVSMNIFPEDKDQTNVEGTTDLYLKAALKEHETSKNLKNSDINKNIPNGKIKIKNGHALEPLADLSTTRNIDGLQTTEI